MTLNVGNADRIARALIGLAILSLFFVLEGSARWWGLIGLLPLGTAVFRFCPAYALLGMNTCGGKAKPGSQLKR